MVRPREEIRKDIDKILHDPSIKWTEADLERLGDLTKEYPRETERDRNFHLMIGGAFYDIYIRTPGAAPLTKNH